ncbi:MAG: hypothetical protein OEW75_09300, partial [Cyclobacteriaceae bacterium]|nr:hypothetical protein [Cyclobacteriaceae bacterium]
MNWIYQIPALIILLFWVWKLNRYALTTTIYKYFWPSLFFKIISGLSIGALYYYYYQQGDTIAYFSDAVYLRSFASSYPIEYLKYIFFNEIHSDFGNYLLYSDFAPRAVFFAKIVSIVNLLCFDNYWLTSLFFSLFSFTSLFLLCNILINVYKKLYFPAIVSLLFLPGFVFW